MVHKYSKDIFEKIVEQLYANAVGAVIATALTITLMAYFYKDLINSNDLLFWCSLNAIAMLSRTVLYLFFKKSEPQKRNYFSFYALYNLIVFLSGTALGSCAKLLFLPQNPECMAFTYFILGGLIIGASSSLAISSFTFFLYAIPVYIPFTIIALVYNFKMGVMGSILFIFISYINSTFKRVFVNNLINVQKNERLMELLSAEKTKLSQVSRTDELTGLYNRRGFMVFAEKTLNLTLQQDKTGHFIYADLDDLKSINDIYGHKEGDFALVKAAEVLKKIFRNVDIIGRIGGDEFTILTTDTDGVFIPILEKRMQEQLKICNEQIKKPYTISFSFGVVPFSNQGRNTLDELFSQSDQLLYEKKKCRRNC